MQDYQKMYSTLFNKITNIIEELQEIQKTTENIYIEQINIENQDNS